MFHHWQELALGGLIERIYGMDVHRTNVHPWTKSADARRRASQSISSPFFFSWRMLPFATVLVLYFEGV